MSALTNVPHTEEKKQRGPYSKPNTPSWRDAFQEDLEKCGDIGVYLRGIRIRERLTQKQLAKKLGKGTTQHHISEMENGKRSISKDMAKRLGEVLHADYRMFL